VESAPETVGDLAHCHWLPVSQERDAAETLANLGESFDWVVVDHYALDARWHGLVRRAAGRLLAIDDLADRQLDCDILVDQNLQNAPDRYDRLLPEGCSKLIGPKYALLREAFERLRPAALARSVPIEPRIVVFMGGVDMPGVTWAVLQAIDYAALDSLPVEVVANSTNPRYRQILEWCATHTTAVHHDLVDMAELFARSDLAIGAFGASTWERCCLGVPSLAITIADNQRPIAQAVASAGLAVLYGDVANLETSRLAEQLSALAEDRPRRAVLKTVCSAIVDGRGAQRVIAAMIAREPSPQAGLQ
jgi:UDP-2,4-diacetamido-2,4,6-trideoxy-beta-L-altropyranose hydrolase